MSLSGLRAQQHAAFVKEIQGALADLGDVPVPDGLPELARAVRRLMQVAEAAEKYRGAADWYRRCLEDVQDRRPVRGLGEAKAGYDAAQDRVDAALAAVSVGLRGERDTTKEAE